MAWLTEAERNILGLVLEPRLPLTLKKNPALQYLSLYSSELKNLQQVAEELKRVRDGTFASREDRTRARYFRSLKAHGVVSGEPAAPLLTPEAQIVFDVAATFDGSKDFWRRNRDLVETPLFRASVVKLTSGRAEEVAEPFKTALFNAQLFFDLVPSNEIAATISDVDLLKYLQFMNSVGFEVGRYFRLSEEERSSFIKAFDKVLRTDPAGVGPLTSPEEQIAMRYRQASGGTQDDVRYRVAGFLQAYDTVQAELGNNFPRISRDLTLKSAVSVVVGSGKAPIALGSASKPLESLGPRQLVVSGCPGSGKSHWLDAQVAESGALSVRTQFHTETSYFDFVGNYKPVPVYESLAEGVTIKSSGGESYAFGRPLISYEYVPGPLMQAYVLAMSNPDRNVVLIVEELNRGNAAAIFGDILQLLDRGEDGSSKYGILPSPELKNYLYVQGGLNEGESLRLPPNLYLWATMNSADQGVFPLDSAFRRRWEFAYRGHREPCAYPDEDRFILYGGVEYDWDAFRSVINSHLRSAGVHEDKLIGPYFLTQKQLKSADAILHKLFLYLWDDAVRFQQDVIFSANNFSEVADDWMAGVGSPLSVKFDALIPKLMQGEESDAGAAAPVVNEGVQPSAPA